MGEPNKETKQLLEASHAAGPEVGRSAKNGSRCTPWPIPQFNSA